MKIKGSLILMLIFLGIGLANPSQAAHSHTSKGGKIQTDSNFQKLSQVALAFNECLRTQAFDNCKSFLAENDEVIKGIEIVESLLPKLPFIVKHFKGEITWLSPKGRESTVDQEHLYSLLGKTAMKTGQTFYLRYLIVFQKGKLKIYGIDFEGKPIMSYWP